MKIFVTLLSALVSLPIYNAETSSPQWTVNEFYTREIRGPFTSDGRLLGNARHLLSKELDALLSATDHYQDACTKLVPPHVKPWIIDGDPWYYYSSDGARSIEGTALISQGESASLVSAKLGYDPSITWTDTITLVKVDGSWRIANIRFEQGGSLIGALDAYIEQSCTTN